MRYSRVTGSGVEGLRAALPRCKVEFRGRRLPHAATGAAHPQGTGDQAVAEWARKLGGKVELANGKVKSILAAVRARGRCATGRPPRPDGNPELDLSATEIGDLGLASLKSITSLRELILNNTTVSDTGLRQLAELHNLRRLGLDGTLVRGRRLSSPQGAASARTWT